MELSLQQRRKALETKIPDIEQTLKVVKYLEFRRQRSNGELKPGSEDEDGSDLGSDDEEEEVGDEKLKTLFELNDTLFAEAEVDETGQVGLWLGVSHRSYILLPPSPFRFEQSVDTHMIPVWNVPSNPLFR